MSSPQSERNSVFVTGSHPGEEAGHPALAARRYEYPQASSGAATGKGEGGLWVRCFLCPQRCRIAPGESGRCRVRVNRGGTLYATNYGRLGALSLDPVEKKPLYHFYPGALILSAGTVGCNFHCEFCQNWELAHGEPELVPVTPEQLRQVAEHYRSQGNIGLAYTYSEPLMWYEFVLDTSRLVAGAGMKNVLVTNGFISEEPLRELLPFIHALNIDIKGFTAAFYRNVVHGAYKPVLRSALVSREFGCHVELTTLLVPGLNDSDEELRSLVNWVASELGNDTPLHFSRYFPNYKMKLSPTPTATLLRAWDLAREKLQYVYLGNISSVEAGGRDNDTKCPYCGQTVIERRGYQVRVKGLLQGPCCSKCGRDLAFVMK